MFHMSNHPPETGFFGLPNNKLCLVGRPVWSSVHDQAERFDQPGLQTLCMTDPFPNTNTLYASVNE